MKKLFITLAFGFFALCSSAEGYTSVSNSDFEIQLSDTSVVCLDVRTPAEYAEGHLNGAVNIDVRSADFKQISLSSLDKKKTIAVYCRSGRRSKMAAGILSAEGYKVVELDKGIMGWMAENRVVVK